MKKKREGTFACGVSLNVFKYVVLDKGYSGFFTLLMQEETRKTYLAVIYTRRVCWNSVREVFNKMFLSGLYFCFFSGVNVCTSSFQISNSKPVQLTCSEMLIANAWHMLQGSL